MPIVIKHLFVLDYIRRTDIIDARRFSHFSVKGKDVQDSKLRNFSTLSGGM